MKDHKVYIAEAIQEAEISVKKGSYPFAVVVVDPTGKIVLREHDRVKEYTDPTAHGEVNAIRALCKKLNTLSLEGHKFYTTSEPCPTCLSAMIKAKISRNVYGAKTESNASLPIPAEELAVRANNRIEIIGGILEKECLVQRNKFRK